MRTLKEALREKPAYANLFVLTTEKVTVKLSEARALNVIERRLTTEEATMLADRYYEFMAEAYPTRKIVSFGIPPLELTYEDARDHVRRNTDIGKFLVRTYQDLVGFALKRLSGEIPW